jgi:predicted secreted protein
MATAGKNASLWVGDTLIKVAEGTDCSITVNGTTIDTTNFDSGEWSEFINSVKNFDLSLTANFKATDTAQVAIMNNIITASQDEYPFEYRLTSAAAPKFSGDIITENYSVSTPVADKITLTASLKGVGALVFTAS